MKTHTFTTTTLLSFAILSSAFAQNIGVGERKPGSRLSVKGGLAIGSNYSTLVSPAEGAIIQGQVGIGTSTPNTSALMDFQSTSMGVLLPRMTSLQRNAIQSPAAGLLVFDTDVNSFFYYNGIDSGWSKMTTTSPRESNNSGKSDVANTRMMFTKTNISVAPNETYNNVAVGDATYIQFAEKSGTGNFYVSGIGGGIDGQMIVLENNYNNRGRMIIPAITPGEENTNRIFTQNGEALFVEAGKSITLIYDGSSSNWRTINWQH